MPIEYWVLLAIATSIPLLYAISRRVVGRRWAALATVASFIAVYALIGVVLLLPIAARIVATLIDVVHKQGSTGFAFLLFLFVAVGVPALLSLLALCFKGLTALLMLVVKAVRKNQSLGKTCEDEIGLGFVEPMLAWEDRQAPELRD